MKTGWILLVMAGLVMIPSVEALIEKPLDSVEVEVKKHKPKFKVIEQTAPSANIICIERARTGTRIKKLRCQTVAAWRAQLGEERLKVYLLEM